MEQDERKILKSFYMFEIGDGYHMGDQVHPFDDRLYVSCNTNPRRSPGRIIYRASVDRCGQIEVIMYTYWKETLKKLFDNTKMGNGWTWRRVLGGGRADENMWGIGKVVDSVKEGQDALQYLYKMFDKRLRDEAPQGAKRTAVCTKATKSAKTCKRPAKLM